MRRPQIASLFPRMLEAIGVTGSTPLRCASPFEVPGSTHSHARRLPVEPLTCGYSPRSNDLLTEYAEAQERPLVEIAELLGVIKQRAHQIAERRPSPIRSPKAPAAESGADLMCRRGRSNGDARSLGANGS
jgi:hypothetical protein